MSKQIINQRLIYKIHSSRFRINNWDLKLTLQEAKDNEEVVALGDSITLRMIRKIKGDTTTEEDIFDIKKKINKLKKRKKDNSEKIIELYDELESKTLIEDYLEVVFDNIADWDKFNKLKTPVFFNDNAYRRLVGTNGGVKNNVVVFCKQDIYEELDKKLNNGRNKKNKYVPAKFESYKALACSVSTPVTQPKGVLVIKDGEREIVEKVLQLTDDEKGGFELIPNNKYKINRAFTDGCGMIAESLSKQWSIDLGEYIEDKESKKKIAIYTPSGFNIRNSWTKGMVFTFPYIEFADDVVHEYMVEDAWGKLIDIRKVELILTTNMLKLWDAYDSIDDYLDNCKENDFEYCVAKMLPQELESVRNMNYQFLQSYEFSDEDIQELIKPTVDSILGAIGGDYGKTLLFLKGNKITEKDFLHGDFDFIKALMIDENLKKDPFVKQRIHRMIQKRINDAKKGVIQVNGNYSVISGDLYALCEYMFKKPVQGLLNKDEFYARTWLDKNINKVVAYRAPMTNHNNIKIFNLKDNDKLKKWYRFMTTCTVLNSYDTTVDMINGADFDGDAVITTNNNILLKNTRELLPIICEQKSIDKRTITDKALRNANKNGFGNDVGSVTNKCTGMFDVLAKFNKDSKEYEILNKRIICMQGYQQEVIDSVKGCIAKDVPKQWYDYKTLKINEINDSLKIKELKKEQLNLASLKKPYFFIYNYKHLMNRYKKYIKDSNTNSIIRFGKSLEELIQEKDDLTSKNELTDIEQDELDFITYYNLLMPVSTNNSTMNKICWALEDKFKDIRLVVNHDDFDVNLLKSEYTFSQSKYNEVQAVYNEYKEDVKQYMITCTDIKSQEKKEKRREFVNNFRKKVYKISSNKYVLCNILVDMCYSNKESKQFVWDICGKTIIETLLEKNNKVINYPVIVDKDEDFIWNGIKYKMVQKTINEEDNFIC
jgi:hypothetical protein